MSGLVPGIIRRFETVVETAAGAHAPLRRAAQEVSERALWAARVELSMQALTAACVALLETDEAGRPVNVDFATGRILAPMPWGKAGGAKWGLRSSEQRVLAHLLRSRAMHPGALFVYERRQWFVQEFGRQRAELYLRKHPLTVPEYRAAWDECAFKWSRLSVRRDRAQAAAQRRTR